MARKNCDCGNPLPPISKVRGKCDVCAMLILTERKKEKAKKKSEKKREEIRKENPHVTRYRNLSRKPIGRKLEGFKKRKAPKVSKEARERRDKAVRAFYDFCAEVWQERCDDEGNCYCEETGQWLGPWEESKGMCVSHILPKSTHPELYFIHENVNILHPDEHRKWETGKREEMKIFPSNQQRIEELKELSRFLLR